MTCDRCGIKDAVFYQSLALFSALPILLYQSREIIREHRNKSLLITFMPATAIGTPIGNYLQEHIPSDIVRLVVGIIICIALGNALRNLVPESSFYKKLKGKDSGDDDNDDNEEMREKDRPDGEVSLQKIEDNSDSKDDAKTLNDRPTSENRGVLIDVDLLNSTSLRIGGVVAGLLSGFLGGLVGLRGPPLMVFFLSFPFPKNVIRANSMLILVVNSVIRICYYVVEDLSGTKELSWFQSDLWYLYVCVIVFGVLGIPLGQAVANRMDQNQFKLVIAFMLFISGLTNIIKGSIQVAQRS